MGFGSSYPPFENMGEALADFVGKTFTQLPNLDEGLQGSSKHVVSSLIQAFNGQEYIHSATSIVLIHKSDDQISSLQFRMGCMRHHPWGLSLPKCGFGCSRHSVSTAQPMDLGVVFRCSCGAETGWIDKPAEIQDLEKARGPGMYQLPFPWPSTHSLIWRKGSGEQMNGLL